MNIVLAMTNPGPHEELLKICRELKLPHTLVLHAKGTAVGSMLDILGIESTERRMVITIAGATKTKQFIREARRRIYIGVPGHGMITAVPIKSVGGGQVLSYLQGQEVETGMPEINYGYEVIMAICNKGKNDMVMNAARAAGARGGTVLHGRGTGSPDAEKFYNVTIGTEKEVVIIVSRSDDKAGIMKEIIRKAGPHSEAGTIVFSLPVTEVSGFTLFDEEEK